jgi:glycerophosphoryl diester phosphodiesterase
MARKTKQDEKPLQSGPSVFRRIGHKGADAIERGNTLDSFDAAVAEGVDMIEFDVLRAREGTLVIAHDHQDALNRRALGLTEALDAFTEPPLDEVEIDCDLKLPGREAELAGALQGRGLVERAMVSTMEISSLQKLRQLEPDLRLGWTYPKTRRDWTQHRMLGPALTAGLALMRRQFPKAIGERADQLGLSAVWAYHMVISPNAVEEAEQAGVELIAWTVDDLGRMVELIKMGVHGICSNDPRLFDQAEKIAAGDAPMPEPEDPDVMEELDEEAEPASDEVPEGQEKERKAAEAG